MNNRESFFKQNQDADNLEYHRIESELRAIVKPVEALLNTWLKSDLSNRVTLLKNILQDNLNSEAASFSYLPAFIQKILTNPRQALPSLNPSITNEKVAEVIRQVIENIISQHADVNTPNTSYKA